MESNITLSSDESINTTIDHNLPFDAKPIVVTVSRKGKRWSVDEDISLKQEIDALTPDGCTLIEYINMHDTLSQIAEKHGRTSGAIKFRLLHLAHRVILDELKIREEKLKTLPSYPDHQSFVWSCVIYILKKFALTKDEYIHYLQTNPKEMGTAKQYIQRPESEFVFDESAYF